MNSHLYITGGLKKGLKIGVCDIYRLRYYRDCCFNDGQFDNIEYFAKPQLTPT